MRVVWLGNGRLGGRVLQWLIASGDEVVAAIVHEPSRRRDGETFIDAARAAGAAVVDAARLAEPSTLDQLRDLAPDIGVSVLFGSIVRKPFLDLFPLGCVNLHPAYLPYNRGAYPNVWSIVDRTPAGVTLHYIDEGIDTGDVIAQRAVGVEPTDTGRTLYERLERESFALFTETWPRIRTRSAARTPQAGGGTSHRVKDVDRIDRIDLDEPCTARDLIDRLRARTFPPHRSAFFVHEGRRIYVRLQLLTEDEIAAESPK